MPRNNQVSGREHLILDANGNPIPHLANCIQVLAEAESCLAFNDLKHTPVLTAHPPWHMDTDGDALPAWDDHQVMRAQVWIQRHSTSGLAVSFDTTARAAEVIARRHTFHPTREWILSLRPNGTDKLDTWLIDQLGAPDTPFVRKVCRCILIGGVARIMEPGCRFDTVLVLEGPQGACKSTAVEIMGGEWYLDGLGSEGKLDKEAVIAMAGYWIVELSEIDYQLRSNNASAVKAFLSRRTDTYRPLYGRSALQAPRQSIFVGTTNKDLYLVDSTGNRRFLPVPIFTKGGEPNAHPLTYIMPQLWAEAYVAWKSGERYWFEGRQEMEMAEEEADERYIPDLLETMVEQFCREGGGWRTPITTPEAAAYIMDHWECTKNWKGLVERVAAMLKRFGYRRDSNQHRNPANGEKIPRQFRHV